MLFPQEFAEGGQANGRAISYLATHFSETSSVLLTTEHDLILWFAGASAMAGLAKHRSQVFAALRDGAGVGESDASLV
jgi:hypothetical protein